MSWHLVKVTSVFSIVDKYVGIDRVGCWHLNDSHYDRGAKDRHAHIGEVVSASMPLPTYLRMNDGSMCRAF